MFLHNHLIMFKLASHQLMNQRPKIKLADNNCRYSPQYTYAAWTEISLQTCGCLCSVDK